MGETVSGTVCRDGPEGASHKRFLTPFPPRASIVGLATLPLVIVSVAGQARAEGKSVVSAERTRAIAAMLGERPAGVGRPVTERRAWKELAEKHAFKGVVRRAERYLTQPLPDIPDELYLDYSRTGNRSRWQRQSWRRTNRLGRLALAECLEDRGRFLAAFDELVRALSAERTWVMPAHDGRLTNFKGTSVDIDLRSASLAWKLATAHYLLETKLRPETRRLIRDEVRRRVLDPFRDMATGKRKGNWWTRTTNNWNAVCLAGVTGAALALVEDRCERALFVAAAEEYSKSFLRGFAADGYCTEGLGYWNYGFGHFVLLAEVIFQATGGGVDLMERGEAKLPATFAARIEIARGVYPAFADCSVKSRPSSRVMHFISRRYGLGLRRWEEKDTASPGGALFESMIYSLGNSVSTTPFAEPAPGGLGPRTWFDDAGILICRPGEYDDCRLAVALKGGHNREHHNHNDVGSFVVVVGREPVLLDPGSEVYTARTFSKRRYESKVLNSWGHPVPVVAGELQRAGKEARGRVVRTEFTDLEDTLVLDISSAYEVPELTRLHRTFVYSREGPGSLTVTDEVEFTRPKQFGTALITLGRWKELDDRTLFVFDIEGAVRVEIDTGGVPFEVKAEEIKEDVRTKTLPTRIGIDLKKPVTRATVSVTITPADLPAEGKGLLKNGGFELGSWGWSVPKQGMASLSNERAAGGETSLRIVDKDEKKGSNVSSARARVTRGGSFELRGKVFPVEGSGVGVYVKMFDEAGKMLNETKDDRGYIDPVLSLGGSSKKWETFAKRFTAPDGTAFLQVWIHSFNASVVEVFVDELQIVKLEE